MADRRIFRCVHGLAAADRRTALGVVELVCASSGGVPFPLVVLEELRRLTDSDEVGYVEEDSDGNCGTRATVTRFSPSWLFANLAAVGGEDPTRRFSARVPADPIAISDFVGMKAFQQTRLYDLVCHPLGVEDSLRLYLPSQGPTTRFFFFDRAQRGFTQRTRSLLTTLQPFLRQSRDSWAPAHAESLGLTAQLTRREADVLGLVADGATNVQIARSLWTTESTVCKHLQHIYLKLGVHNRTAAVAALRSALPTGAPQKMGATALTRRETDVLSLVARGATNRQIAQQLWITEHTVRKHLENSFRKLGVHTRAAAVAQLTSFQN